MTLWLLVLILLTMPWKQIYYLEIMVVPVIWDDGRCRNNLGGCYYDDTMYLKSEWREVTFDPEFRRVAIHEIQHHFQCKTAIWRNPGGWSEFERIVKGLLYDEDLTQVQVAQIEWVMDNYLVHDIHAELPFILDGKIPVELAEWYPWFDTSPKSDRNAASPSAR